MEVTKFEEWALVELFGHQRIAGRVTESEIAGGKFIRVDVPELDKRQGVTKFFTPAAIYGITPLNEETAIALAKTICAEPVSRWDARVLLDAHPRSVRVRGLPEPDEDDHDSSTGE